ncbi:aurora kinase A and ninein-interacting protein [Xenopus laevis]|uniref:Aurora kinase A and ninein-interacting protein n=2 Tax=Xenopus laevis TaxID=8355 RepID=A0A974HY45_XENLA|nr:aurora kinase A and ninein-interacting protein [Xenopus laevis]OCT94475.1 hypothetical protein XELAEV_18012147mg [Xenopus laevis]
MKLKGKNARSLQQTEECGVWLDTAELKRKPTQTVLPNSSSVRFHPFSRRKPFELAAFDFTQTKTPQPCTKQTSMHYYFTKAGNTNEVLKKKCKMIDHLPTVTASVHEKDIRENTHENSNTVHPFSDTMCPLGSTGAIVFLKDDNSMNNPAEDQESPDSCERHTDMEQPITGEHGSDMLENLNPSQTSSFRCDSLFKRQNDVQITLSCATSCRDVEKRGNASCNLLDLPLKWCSNEKSENEQDDLHNSVATSQLFTQDSQGNRVISHYWKKQNSFVPLQDMTNTRRDLSSKSSDLLSCNDYSLQRMFTQDSEGNVVIKH